MVTKREKFIKRKARVRSKISGSKDRPRLSVFRSNKEIYAQIIDDSSARTLVSASSKEKIPPGKTKSDRAFAVGELIAEKAKKAKVKKVVFDKSGYKFHGRVKALAEGARKGGLEF
jgi:large subunit ribosomal protein L18